MNKIIKNVTLIVGLLVVIGIVVYYFLPKASSEPQELPLESYLELKIVKEDLADWQKQKYLEDFASVKESLEQRPDQLEGWVYLGVIKKQVGDYQGAEAAWIKAGQLRPKNSTSFGNLADLYVNFTKEYDKAEPAYRTAIENSAGEAKNVSFYRNLYYFYYYNLEDMEKAEATLLEAVAFNSGSSETLALLAEFYKAAGETDKAIDYYQQALDLNPDSQSIKRELNELTQ